MISWGTVEIGLCELSRLGFSLIFGQLCDKKYCAFVVMGIGKKFVWAGGGDGQRSLSRLSLFCWRVCVCGVEAGLAGHNQASNVALTAKYGIRSLRSMTTSFQTTSFHPLVTSFQV